MNDPIPAPVHELLALFAGELAEVKFPDVDATVLAASAADVHAAAEALARAEAELAAAKDALAVRQDALVGCAQRALAYARVFAAADPRLSPRLEAIALPKPRRAKVERDASEPPRPRGRPRKIREAAPVALADAE